MDLEALEAPLIALCERASVAIMQVYDAAQSPLVAYKSDQSPVTAADTSAHKIIVAGLRRLTPELPVLSEEQSLPTFSERRRWQRYWLVDPLDGTREFIDRNGEFTINIALIDGGRPLLGVVYVPLERRAYYGLVGSGAWKVGGGDRKALAVSGAPAASVRVLTSARQLNDELEACLQQLRGTVAQLQRLKVGSALKFCRLAEGSGDIYPRFSPCCEWDTGAGQALLEAAGGALVTADGEALRYNSKPSLINPNFYALGGSVAQWWPLLSAPPG